MTTAPQMSSKSSYKTLQKWLSTHFNIHLDLLDRKDEVVEQDDGQEIQMVDNEVDLKPQKLHTLIPQILYKSHRINTEQWQMFNATESPLDWFNYLNFALRQCDIPTTDAELIRTINGDRNTILGVLHRIHTSLTACDAQCPWQQQQQQRHQKKPHRFTVERCASNAELGHLLRTNPLAEPILEQWDLIGWYRDHLVALRRQSERIRTNYEHFLEVKKQQRHVFVAPHSSPSLLPAHQLDAPCPDKEEGDLWFSVPADADYQTLLVEQERAHDMMMRTHAQQRSGGVSATAEAKRTLNSIRHRRREREARITRDHLQTEAIREALMRLRRDQKDYFETSVTAAKLERPAVLERTINRQVETLVRQQCDLMRANAELMAEVQRQRDDEAFIRALLEEDAENVARFCAERDEKLALHRRLYADRLAEKQRNRERMCRSVAGDLVDLSLRHAEYKRTYGTEPNRWRRESWARLFIQQLPIFDLVTPLTRLPLDGNDYYLSGEDGGDHIGTTGADDGGSDTDLLVPHVIFEESERQSELNCVELRDYRLAFEEQDPAGCCLFGHIIHYLLLEKYPDEPPPRPAFMNTVKIAACCLKFPPVTAEGADVGLLSVSQLRQFLPNGVKLLRLEDAIKFCVTMYEMEADEVDGIEEIVRELQPSARGAVDKSRKTQDGKHKIKAARAIGEKQSAAAKSDKSSKKKQKKKKGAPEAAVDQLAAPPEIKDLSEKTSQTPRLFPSERTYTVRAQLGRILKEQAALINGRLRAQAIVEYLKACGPLHGWVLLDYPDKLADGYDLEAHLSGKLVPKLSSNLYSYQYSRLFPPPPDGPYTTCLTSFVRLVEKDEFGIDVNFAESEAGALDRFYADQRCGTIWAYQELNRDKILELANLIITNFREVPPPPPALSDVKPSVEETPRLETERTVKGKKHKTGVTASEKSSKSDKKDKKADKSKVRPPKVLGVDREIQVPELEPPVEDDSKPRPKPGDPDWLYVRIQVSGDSAEFGEALATEWELIEANYIDSMKKLMFKRRVNASAIEAFLANTQKRMVRLMDRPDVKQCHLSEFQQVFNELMAHLAHETDVQCVADTQKDVLERIKTLRQKLMDICDATMRTEADQRLQWSQDKWFDAQKVCLVENYSSAVQLEMDRFLATYQLVTDYYASYVTREPLRNQTFPSTTFIPTLTAGSMSIEAGNCLDVLRQRVTNAHSCTEANRLKAEQFANTTRAVFAEKLLQLNSQKRFELDGPHELQLLRADDAFEEWSTALHTELRRVRYYLEHLLAQCRDQLVYVDRLKETTFDRLYEAIRSKYEIELDRVETACWVLSRATREQMVIGPILTLNLHISCTALELFPTIHSSEDCITITQLDNMVNVLVNLAPNGLIATRTFISLLQEWVAEEALPSSWRHLSTAQMTQLCEQIFDPYEMVPWRDWIIQNLPTVGVPNRDQLLATRWRLRHLDEHQLELISAEEYNATAFWYCQPIVKVLLYKMYKMQNGAFNYTAMLLDFCKDATSPVWGFVKALEMSLGAPICTDAEVGEQFRRGEVERRHHVEMEVLRDECYRMIRAAVEQSMQNPYGFEQDLWDGFMRRLQEEEILANLDVMKEECYKAILSLVEVSMERPSSFDAGLWLKFRSQLSVVEERHPPTPITSQERFSSAAGSHSADNSNPPAALLAADEEDKPCSAAADHQMAFLLPLDLVTAVVAVALPWSNRASPLNAVADDDGGGALTFQQCLKDIYEECRCTELEGDVLAHNFLNHPQLVEMMRHVKRFTVVNVAALVCVLSRTCK